MRTNHYISQSLELHLFFSRIMKEHALFLQAGFTPANTDFAEKAGFFRQEFEALLREAVALSDGLASQAVLYSGEVATEFTVLAEQQTECFTCIPIDREITERSLCLTPGDKPCRSNPQLHRAVRQLNRKALRLLDGLIDFKESILRCVQQGSMFTMNYPLLIEHILREARLYRKYVGILEREGALSQQALRNSECFWNQIMMEHAQFIRGLLDPCETELIATADNFAKQYGRLLEECKSAHDQTLTIRSLAKTTKFRDFKAAGTQGIQQNRIRSVILPLLADHVLREANHYLRLLQP